MSQKPHREFTVKTPKGESIEMKFYYKEGMDRKLVDSLQEEVSKNPRNFWAVQTNQGLEFDHRADYNGKFYHIGQGDSKFAFTITPK